MKRLILFFMICFCISTFCLADEDFDLTAKSYQGLGNQPGVRPGPRHDFAWAFRYNPNGENNHLYVTGGVDGANHLMDADGSVWRATLHLTRGIWKHLEPVEFSEIPPHRYGHSGGICTTLEPIFNAPSQASKIMHNFITFGGFDSFADDYSNETWVFTEFKVKIANRDEKKYWQWVKADNTAYSIYTPVPRAHAAMVSFVDDNDENCFFLLGGKDDTGLLEETWIGTFDRMTPTPTPTGPASPTPTSTWGGTNEIGIECEMEWRKMSDPPEGVGLEGAAAVYDPYYGENPRILVYGGINVDNEISSEIHQYDISSDTWPTFGPALTPTPTPTTGAGTPTNTPHPTYGTPVPRCYHAMALDIREHRLLVHGGSDDASSPDYTSALDDLWEYDILTQKWRPLATTDTSPRWKHAGVFNWFTSFGGQDDSGNSYDDLLEYKPAESGKTWDVMAGSDYGLDHPETVINTQRVKPNDVVRIHQTGSSWPGDVFSLDEELYIPYFVSNLTIEGVNNDDIRAGLWREYAPVPTPTTAPPIGIPTTHPMLLDAHTEEGLTGLREGFTASKSTIIQDCSGITLRNLIIGHYPVGGSPDDDLDSTMLTYYEHVSNTTSTFVEMQMLDVAMVATAPARVENCEFLANGAGYVMICVSSSYYPNWVHDCVFENNMIGIVELETRHRVYNNIFTGNKLCGIEFDKGAHGMAYDNLFIDNGDSNAKSDWLSGIISGYSIAADVPAVQQPLIYNNTFIDNPAALSIWEDGDIRQFVNSPCFFNNILYSTQTSSDPAVIRVNNTRNRLISFHNCMDGYDSFFEHNSMKLTSAWDFIADPLFSDTEEYRLDTTPTTSPCIDSGYHSLSPGATDMTEIMDTAYMDIGYHFTDVDPVMGPPENLSDNGTTLSWSAPSGESPTGYVVYWEDEAGILMGQVLLSTTSYSIGSQYRDQGFWFGVCAHENGQYGETAFIEL